MPYYGWRSLYVVEPWSAEVSGEVHAYCYNRRSLLVIYSTDIVWQHYQLIEPWIQAGVRNCATALTVFHLLFPRRRTSAAYFEVVLPVVAVSK